MKYKIAILALIFLGACGIPTHQSTDNLTKFDENNVYQGQYADQKNATEISFLTSSDDESGVLSVEIVVNNKIFQFELIEGDGLKNLDGRGAVLTIEERAALSRMSQQLATQDLQSFSNHTHVVATYTGADYLSQAPDGHVIQSRSFEPSLGLRNEGITCIKKGTTVKAEWRDRNSTAYSENVLVGTNWPNNYGCMGRCGSDCGWGAPSSWTKDCMDHDVCSFRHNASGGASDPNCGETFNQAADDWFWGVWYGCSG
ncbi:MAG: hypothetical protein ACOH5I_10555 [Oligoflexus sp.]